MSSKAISKKERVAVAMSGGIDSSVAAAILKKEGYDVIGVTFRMWPKEECGQSAGRACCDLESVTRARAVAGQLKMPYYVFDFSSEFKKEVIDYFCAQYAKGLTPNPCVICNEKIKFGLLFGKARSLGASYLATGHYARVLKRGARYILREGADKKREQSYFLFSLAQEQLKRAVFPLGGLTKERCRVMAKRFGLMTYDTVSSQDICFAQDKRYADFIRRRTGIGIKPGEIVDSLGKVLGSHKGIPYYTIGQRRGLGIAFSQPLYVTAIDVKHNRIIVGIKKDVLKKSLIAEKLNWISRDGIKRPVRLMAMIRYNHKKVKAMVRSVGNGIVRVDFDKPQEAPTPGQAVVFYERDIVVGGGWIRKV